MPLHYRCSSPSWPAGAAACTRHFVSATTAGWSSGSCWSQPIFAIQIVVRGNVSIFDAIVLLALYALYARRVQGTHARGAGRRRRRRRPPLAPAAIPTARDLSADRRRRLCRADVANPFADALLATGTSLGIDPYLLIQSVVPLATEAPEFVVVAVLVVNHRPAQGLALFLASSLSQWTLGLGALPIAYLAGGGGAFMPLAGREQLELGFTIAMTLFVVAALATLRPEPADAILILAVFLVQLIYPAPFIRFAAGFVLLVFAIDLLCARHRHVRPVLRAAFGRRDAHSNRPA